MRTFGAAIIALSLSVSSGIAADTGALPAGKPAGVHEAQLGISTPLVVLIGTAILVGIVVGVASNSSNKGTVVNGLAVTAATSTSP